MQNIQIKIEALKLKHARKLKQCDLLQSNLLIAHASGAGASTREAMKAIDKNLEAAIEIETQVALLGTQP